MFYFSLPLCDVTERENLNCLFKYNSKKLKKCVDFCHIQCLKIKHDPVKHIKYQKWIRNHFA